ncbi:hypothetical protein Tco_0390699 [Tanacetum coccineum]
MPHDSPLSGGDTPGRKDPSKQWRIAEIEYEEVEYELDQTYTLQQITPTKVSQGKEQSQESSKVQLDVLSAAKILADASRERVKTYKSYTRKIRSTVSLRDSTAGGLFSTTEEILSIDERIAQKLNEEEMAKAAAREEQERIDFEKALELQKQLDEREETDNIDWSIMAEQVQERQIWLDTRWVNRKGLSIVYYSYGINAKQKLQVEEDSQMARDLVMKIFIEANKPRI